MDWSSPQPGSLPEGSRLTILLVGRHHLLRLLLLAWHDQAGINLSWVDNGLTAIREICRRHHDLVIADTALEGFGVELIGQFLANIGETAPVICLGSGNREKHPALHLDQPGEVRYLIDAVYYAATRNGAADYPHTRQFNAL